jgi:hypothetical protein
MGEFLQSNWIWIVVAVLFVGMHAFGYGCCGHGGHNGHGHDTSTGDEE